MAFHPEDVRACIKITTERRCGWYSFIVVVNKELVKKMPRLDWHVGDSGSYENIQPMKRSYEGLHRELNVYQHLPPHANLLTFYEAERCDGKLRALVLENATYNLWDLLWAEPQSFVPQNELYRWPSDLASVVAHLHKHNVIHCDIASDNIMFTDHWKLKLIDFGWSSVNGSQPNGCEKPRYELPVLNSETRTDRPPELRDLFALGTLIYNIVSWSETFPENLDSEIGQLYRQGHFPDTTSLRHGHTIHMCWTRGFNHASEALASLNQESLLCS